MAGDPVGPARADPAAPDRRDFARLIEARSELAIALVALIEATHGIDRRAVDGRADELDDATAALVDAWRASPLEGT